MGSYEDQNKQDQSSDDFSEFFEDIDTDSAYIDSEDPYTDTEDEYTSIRRGRDSMREDHGSGQQSQNSRDSRQSQTAPRQTQERRRTDEMMARRARQRQQTQEASHRRQVRRERQIYQTKVRIGACLAAVAVVILVVVLVRFLSGRIANGSAGVDGALTANAAVDSTAVGQSAEDGTGAEDGSSDGNTAGADGTDAGNGGTKTETSGTAESGSPDNLPSAEQVEADRAAKNYSSEVATFWPYYTFHTTDATQTIPLMTVDASTGQVTSGDVVGATESSYGIVVNADTGEILAQRDMNERIVPASMTKVMTLLVAVEQMGLTENSPELHDMVTLTTEDEEYAYINGSSAVCWMPGDTATVEDLMYGTILPSGADAAVALAEKTAGSQENFVRLMNQKAQELGIGSTTHFTNCVGVYDEDHYSTAYDVAVIMKAALENDLCRKVLAEHTWTTSPTSEHPEGITVSNWFLRRIEDKDTHGLVLCAKTGFVNQSGFCAVSYQESDDGSHLIVCTADSSGNWRCINDHVSLYQKYAKEVPGKEETESSSTDDSNAADSGETQEVAAGTSYSAAAYGAGTEGTSATE